MKWHVLAWPGCAWGIEVCRGHCNDGTWSSRLQRFLSYHPGSYPINCHWLLTSWPMLSLSPPWLQTCHLELQMLLPNCWPVHTVTGATSAWRHWRSTLNIDMKRMKTTLPALCATTHLPTAPSLNDIWPRTSQGEIRWGSSMGMGNP